MKLLLADYSWRELQVQRFLYMLMDNSLISYLFGTSVEQELG